VPRTRTKLPILPEVREAADRLVSRRAMAGAALYPFIVVTVGLGADLPQRRPYLFAFLLAGVVSVALLRLYLMQRFEPLYRANARLWRAAFYGAVALNGAFLGRLFAAGIERFGAQVGSFFILTVTGVIAMIVVIVFSHSPRVASAFVVLLILPLLPAMGDLFGPLSFKAGGWESICIGIFFVYLFSFIRHLYQERWTGLTSTHLLAVRAAELERARDELRKAHDELEQLVDERTAELKKAGEDYRRVFENAHDAILILAPDDETVLNVNQRACEIYGFSREEFLGMSLQDITENIPRGRQQIADTMEQGVFYNFETTQFRRDGSRMFLEINASLIEYEGRPAILSINRDVTERRRTEELRRAKDAAEEADRAKSRFLANMSHEIRTPMAGVLGLGDLLLKTELSPQQRDYIHLIQSSATSLLRLIDDILDFSKLEAGRLTLERVAFDLRATLAEIVELLRFRASARGTDLELAIGPSVARWVWGDPGRLRQVMTNLVGNAVKFTEGGRIEVEVQKLKDGRYRFAIKDTGIGISEEAQGRLFEPFSQADSSTSRRYGGSGLGLAISQRIVQQMGGEIGCESQPGVGSTFWFHIGLDTAAEPALEPAPAETTVARPGGQRHRILVAEDNPVNQLVITQHLAAMGYEVLSVNNGQEALETLERVPVDLVLMDCQMPELDGYETTRRIRQGTGENSRVPILALTAHAMRDELDRCLAVGMNDTITKPFRQEILQQRLERWLANGGDGSPAEAPAAPPSPLLPASPTFDGEKLAELRRLGRALGKDVLRNLAESFRSQTCLAEMRSGLARGDRPHVGREAHSLKGSSAALGAVRLATLCEELERLPPETSLEAYAGRVAAIEEEYRRVLSGLVAAAEE
jgi:PAS domain S-box-containing protein